MKRSKLGFLLGVASITLLSASIAHADMNSYRMYNAKSGLHFWTTSGSEKQSLTKSGWKYEGVGWGSVSSGKTPIYRLYSKSGEHFYTANTTEKNNLVKAGYHLEGVYGYSSGKLPVYRLYKRGKAHVWTASLSEKNSLVKAGYKYEGIGFYAIAPEYSWHYDASQGSVSGVANDVHFPQFDYLTSTEGVTKTFQGNNVFYTYNDKVYNFNAQLQSDAKGADYANAQARQNWTNLRNRDQLAVSNAKAALDTAKTKINEAQTLVNQAQSYVTADQQHKLDTKQDQALLTQYQTSLASAKSTYTADNIAYQKAVATLNALNKQGTNYVHLRYSISLTNSGKSVHVNFTKTTRMEGDISTTKITRTTVLEIT
ncbi:hypothetical protein ACWOAN_00635 [Lactococcus taiwanensis]|uniref:hypothetical protein n=1 Tax=Lactococcus taiwanensis TaxID=1151742 RepID=UPI0019060323|nr:hypothetical protein [Lactococcus taiwanensis]